MLNRATLLWYRWISVMVQIIQQSMVQKIQQSSSTIEAGRGRWLTYGPSYMVCSPPTFTSSAWYYTVGLICGGGAARVHSGLTKKHHHMLNLYYLVLVATRHSKSGFRASMNAIYRLKQKSCKTKFFWTLLTPLGLLPWMWIWGDRIFLQWINGILTPQSGTH